VEHKLLFVSIAFPPKNDPECIQAGRYAYHLKHKFNWNLEALTSMSPTLYMPYDHSLEKLIDGIKLNEIRIFESKISNKLLSFLSPKVLSKPDSKYSFHYQWRKRLKEIDKLDIIYSRSFPLSSSIMALKLKRYFDVPWVMHLSDPWVESPLHDMKSKYHVNYERQTFDEADLVSFTTEQTLNLYVKKYPEYEKKFFISSHIADDDLDVRASQRKPNRKIRLVYTGGLANTRTPETFLKGLEIAASKEPKVVEHLEVLFAGPIDSRNREIVEKYRYLNCLKHLGTLKQSESIDLQGSADILLVIDSEISDSEKNVFLPSKIIDYAQRSKYILGITEKGSPCEIFLEKYGGNSFAFEEEYEIAEHLIELIENPKFLQAMRSIPEDYTAEVQVAKLHEKFISLLN